MRISKSVMFVLVLAIGMLLVMSLNYNPWSYVVMLPLGDHERAVDPVGSSTPEGIESITNAPVQVGRLPLAFV